MLPANIPGVDNILFMFQVMMESLNWPLEKWKANMAKVDSMMFSIVVKRERQAHFYKEKMYFQLFHPARGRFVTIGKNCMFTS